MEEITLNLTVDEVNTILRGLGDLPFTEVHQVINKIQQQASTQLNPSNNGQAADK